MVDLRDVQYRRIYGYIGEIEFFPRDDTPGTQTPAMMQIVIQLPFSYGKTKAGTYDSWAHCRMSAFISAAAFGPPVATLRVGGPVAGFVENTNSQEHKNAQLTGWSAALASEWKLSQPAASPGEIELNSDVISAPPQLRKANFPAVRAPNVTYDRSVAPELPKYYAFDDQPVAAPPPGYVEPACTRPRDEPIRAR